MSIKKQNNYFQQLQKSFSKKEKFMVCGIVFSLVMSIGALIGTYNVNNDIQGSFFSKKSSKTIKANEPPIVSDVRFSENPTYPGREIIVTAKVTDRNGIKDIVSVKTEGGALGLDDDVIFTRRQSNINFYGDELESDIFEGVFNAAGPGHYNAKIKATDLSGGMGNAPGEIDVEAGDPPHIQFIEWDTYPALIGETVRISITIEDANGPEDVKKVSMDLSMIEMGDINILQSDDDNIYEENPENSTDIFIHDGVITFSKDIFIEDNINYIEKGIYRTYAYDSENLEDYEDTKYEIINHNPSSEYPMYKELEVR